jgi:formate dehydrogenase subunit delta
MTPQEKLVYMANQIADFFAAQGEERAIKNVADHLMKFWDPDMRRSLLALAAKDASTLNVLVRKALPLLKDHSPSRAGSPAQDPPAC